MTATSAALEVASSAASGDGATVQPGAWKPGRRETMMLRRPSRTRPIDSCVRRPMMTGLPIVNARNRTRSAGRRQGRPPSRPMTRFSAMAATIATVGRFTGEWTRRRPGRRP